MTWCASVRCCLGVMFSINSNLLTLTFKPLPIWSYQLLINNNALCRLKRQKNEAGSIVRNVLEPLKPIAQKSILDKMKNIENQTLNILLAT